MHDLAQRAAEILPRKHALNREEEEEKKVEPRVACVPKFFV